MAIVQISKIQQRSGNIVDLPQLDNAELGWASDARRLFVGNDNSITGIENVEVLTSYSTIDFDQLNGASGNLDIDGANLANGQLMTYDGTNWINRGGSVGGLITLGDVSNVKIDGGAIGYVLETDGTGNLSWTPKSTIVAYIQNATKASPCVITTTENNFFTEGQEVTITNVPGMTQLNGGSYFANVLTSNTFALYSDAGLTTPINSSAYSTFPYTTATATSSTSDQVTVGDATAFTINDPVIFIGDTDTSNSGITVGQTYYVKTKDTSAPNTWVTLSDTVGGSTLQIGNATFTANVYTTGGRAIAAVGGAGTIAASGSNTAVQFNNSNLIDGDSDFTWNFASPKVLTVNGNANVGNLNATTTVTSSRLISNISTGTAPFTVTSTTRVANLNVSYSNVSDFEVVTAQTTGTFYPTFVSASATGNRALGANANLSFNAATGALAATLFTGTLTTAAQPNITSVGTLTSLAVTGNVTSGNANVTGQLISTVATGTAPLVVTSTTQVANLNVATAGTAGTVTTAAQPNITSVGTLTGLSVNGVINATRFVSNISTGTEPVTVTSTTRVANLNVSYANVSDFEVVTAQTTGTFYPVFVNGSSTGNYALGANSNIALNAATGNLSATILNSTGNTNIGNNINLINNIFLGNTTETLTRTVYTSTNFSKIFVRPSFDLNNTGTITSTDAAAFSNYLNGTSVYTTTTNAPPYILNHADNLATGIMVVPVDILSYAVGNTSPGKVYITGGNSNGNAVVSYLRVGESTNDSFGILIKANNTSVTGNLSTTGNIAGANLSITTDASITGNLTAGNIGTAGTVTASTLTSNVATGTAPLTVTSTTKVTNLNADLLDGYDTAVTATANTVVVRNADGNITANNISGTISTAAQTNITSLGTLTSLVVSGSGNLGSLITTLITSGSNSTAGTITGNWSLSAGSKLQSTYADLAEYYSADKDYAPGTVLEFGGEQEVTLATDGSVRVAGVVSTNPAYAMNSLCPGTYPVAIALQGRVPVKVRGKVQKGDLMISGGNGYARPTNNPQMGSVIGKSLENFNDSEGIIEIAVGRL